VLLQLLGFAESPPDHMLIKRRRLHLKAQPAQPTDFVAYKNEPVSAALKIAVFAPIPSSGQATSSAR